jgi:serine/threonine protein kinase
MTSKEQLIGNIINNKYKIVKYIGSGSFGDVYQVINKKTNELFALKVPIITEEKNGQRMLLDEAKIYKHLSNPDKGVANVKVTKQQNKKMIVMDLLGPNIEALFQKYKKFSLQSVIRLAIMMIDILQYIHSNGYIHRDLKPENFVIGTNGTKGTNGTNSDNHFKNDTTKLFLIDFGLAKKFIKKDGSHIDFCDKKKFCGTAKFASIAAHANSEQSRKDDLEAIAYILIYLYRGKLPWQGIKTKDKKKRYLHIYKEKMKHTPEELCKGMPREFIVFLNYIKTLSFDEKPPYSSFKKMFNRLYDSMEYDDAKFEWEES